MENPVAYYNGQSYADAASDAWEPLVVRWRTYLQGCSVMNESGVRMLIDEMTEALGT
jgi:hypothetical protein